LAAAVLLYHVVEEPGRRWMRRMLDVSDPDTSHIRAPDQSMGSRLRPVDLPVEAGTQPVSVRAV
jgi:peptidoglycan/LPS O-acetylase OafA/YrhL